MFGSLVGERSPGGWCAAHLPPRDIYAPLHRCVPLRTTKRPLGGYRARRRAAVGFVERGEAGPCPEASAGRFLRLNTCPYWCFFRVVRLPHQVPRTIELGTSAAAAKNAVISAPRPSGRKRVLPVASSVNTPAAPKLPRTSAALLRLGTGEEACKPIFKVLTVLRVLPRHETAITRRGDLLQSKGCGFPQPLSAAASVRSAVVRPRRTAVPRATSRDADQLRPSELTPLQRRPKESLSQSTQRVRSQQLVVYIERRLGDHSAPSGPKFVQKRLLDCKRGLQPR